MGMHILWDKQCKSIIRKVKADLDAGVIKPIVLTIDSEAVINSINRLVKTTRTFKNLKEYNDFFYSIENRSIAIEDTKLNSICVQAASISSYDFDTFHMYLKYNLPCQPTKGYEIDLIDKWKETCKKIIQKVISDLDKGIIKTYQDTRMIETLELTDRPIGFYWKGKWLESWIEEAVEEDVSIDELEAIIEKEMGSDEDGVNGKGFDTYDFSKSKYYDGYVLVHRDKPWENVLR